MDTLGIDYLLPVNLPKNRDSRLEILRQIKGAWLDDAEEDVRLARKKLQDEQKFLMEQNAVVLKARALFRKANKRLAQGKKAWRERIKEAQKPQTKRAESC